MPKHHNLPKLLVHVDEASDALSIGRTRIFALMASGELASVRVGRSRLIPVAALEEYAERLVAEAS